MKRWIISLLAASVAVALFAGCRSQGAPTQENPSSEISQSQGQQPAKGQDNPGSQPDNGSSPIPAPNGSSPQAPGDAPSPSEAPKESPSSSEAPKEAPSSFSASSAPSKGDTAPAPQENSSSTPKEDGIAGTYSPQEDLGAIHMSLQLQDDGQYTLTLSAFMISGTVSGGYTADGSRVTLTASEVSLPGYSAENVGNLDLTLQEDGSLYYLCGDFVSKVGISQESITFVKE